MSAARRAALELTLAVLAVAGCVGSWINARSAVQVAPVIDGEPSTTSIAYFPPLLFLALLLATAAGVLTVLAVSRLRRARSAGSRPDEPVPIPGRGMVRDVINGVEGSGH